MKKSFFIISLFIMAFSLFGVTDIRIGVIDFNEIASNFLSDTTDLRKINEAESERDVTLNELRSEIADLSDQIFEAEEDDNNRLADILRIEKEQKVAYMQTFNQHMQNKIDRLKKEAYDGSSQRNILSQNILRAIEEIAMKNGFSLILDKEDPCVIWTSPMIDITEDVINELKNMM